MNTLLQELDEVLAQKEGTEPDGMAYLMQSRWFDTCAGALLREHAPEIRAALELQARVTWQPIETAPRDGTRILATIRWEYSDGTAGEAQAVIYWYGGGMFWVAPTPMNYLQGLDDDVKPTHWMPLPAPPAQGEVSPSMKKHDGPCWRNNYSDCGC